MATNDIRDDIDEGCQLCFLSNDNFLDLQTKNFFSESSTQTIPLAQLWNGVQYLDSLYSFLLAQSQFITNLW